MTRNRKKWAHTIFSSIKRFSVHVTGGFTSALLCVCREARQKTIALKAVKKELNKIYAPVLPAKLYPVKESFFIELETRVCSRWMAVLAERLSSATAEKLLKTLKGGRGSGQSTQTAPHCPLTFPLSQTLHRNRLLWLMLFSLVQDRGSGCRAQIHHTVYYPR